MYIDVVANTRGKQRVSRFRAGTDSLASDKAVQTVLSRRILTSIKVCFPLIGQNGYHLGGTAGEATFPVEDDSPRRQKVLGEADIAPAGCGIVERGHCSVQATWVSTAHYRTIKAQAELLPRSVPDPELIPIIVESRFGGERRLVLRCHGGVTIKLL